MKREPRILAAIYDFMAYLSTRKSSCRIGSIWPPYTTLKHLRDWAAIRQVDLDDENIGYWIDKWSDDSEDRKLREEYEVLETAWFEYKKAEEHYLLIKKMITGNDDRKV